LIFGRPALTVVGGDAGLESRFRFRFSAGVGDGGGVKAFSGDEVQLLPAQPGPNPYRYGFSQANMQTAAYMP
jgi:hypothetical protein